MMQPYTPHGDSNWHHRPTARTEQSMQPYTPHGDSNSELRTEFIQFAFMMQPYTPHGDSNPTAAPADAIDVMQPYTPHGDSNSEKQMPYSLKE